MKASKKATANIINIVNSYYPETGKLISFDEAWEYLSQACELEGDIKTDKSGETKFTLFYKGKNYHEFDFKTAFDEKIHDWDWTLIFQTVLDFCIKNKLIKKKRKSTQTSKVNKVSPAKRKSVKSTKNKK